MKRKEEELISVLLQQNEPMSAKDLSERLGVSLRSVKNYVRGINDGYQQKVVLSSRAGYSVSPHAIPVLGSRRAPRVQVPQTPEERMRYILKLLTSSHEKAVSLFDLSEDLCVSYSTVKSLVNRMNTTYAPFGVRFVTRSDMLTMEGAEENKRRFISAVISDEMTSTSTSLAAMDEYFEYVDVRKLAGVVRREVRGGGYYLNDFAATNIVVHLAIILDRAKSGNALTSDDSPTVPADEREIAFMDSLVAALENGFGVTLAPAECGEVYVLFKSNANYAGISSDEQLAQIVGTEVVELTNCYVAEIRERFLVDLSSDAFRTAFAAHLKNLIVRATHGRETQNPLAHSIRYDSPVVFDIAVFVALDLASRYNVTISEGEAAFLAMHVGAEIERQNLNQSKVAAVLLCPEYLDLPARLLNELMLGFGNQLDIRHTVHDQEELQALLKAGEDVQLVITTVPVCLPPTCRVLQVSPVSVNRQFSAIQDMVDELQEARRTDTLRANFANYFEEDLFVVDPPLTTRDEVLTYLCDLLATRGYVGAEFERDVRHREEGASTAFGRIAIPHSNNMDAAKTSVAVAVSDRGFDWGGEKVNMVLLVAINSLGRQVFRNLYESLIQMFGDEKFLSRVVTCATFDEFRGVVLGQ